MTTFEQKERAEEVRYAHDQEMEFRIHARRNKLFGAWAASQIGLNGAEAEDYASSFVVIDWGKPCDETVLDKARQDFTRQSLSLTDHDIRLKLNHSLETARAQVIGHG
jgi:hypothetical protein